MQDRPEQSPVRNGLTITDIEGGFPHSEIRGSKLVRSSPRLIAAYHVLHRLSAPRHPPDTLKTLDCSHYQRPSLGSDRLAREKLGATLAEKTSFASNTSESAAVKPRPRLSMLGGTIKGLRPQDPLIGCISSSRCQIDRAAPKGASRNAVLKRT